MLVNLHVKNFAIIDEVDVDFNKHLNILTGETGAGKSILVGSVNIALGGRISSDMIRKGAEYAMVELVFLIEDENTLAALKEIDIYPEDGQIVISRKIMENRSVNKINGESVPVSIIKQVAELCIDIHGQHGHQSLLHKKNHLEIIDNYKKEELRETKNKYRKFFEQYKLICEELEKTSIPEEERNRQISFLSYEKNEIEQAKLVPNEEEELEQEYRRLNNAGSIMEALGQAYHFTSEQADSVSSGLSHAIKAMQPVTELDSAVEGMFHQLLELENLTNDFNREMADYLSDFTFDEGAFHETSERLDFIRSIYARYGGDYEHVMNHLQETEEKLGKYEDYDAYITKKREEKEKLEHKLISLCSSITKIRKKGAKELGERISASLTDLNFEDSRFTVNHSELFEFTANGKDDIEFIIATNPGEEPKPLAKIASGGELSRIMLAIKSVFAHNDNIETLIFDEIDVGISGRTAQKVSEKMAVLGERHQIICITHLAQIAAMADTHYVIEKINEKEKVHTRIRALSEEQSIAELSRILSGAKITKNVMVSAAEMKEMAKKIKQY